MKKNICRLTIIVLAMLLIMSLACLEAAFADEQARVTEPIDLSEATGTISGSGWSWNSEIRTLTLDGLDMDLSGYKGFYDAAITLPDGKVTIQVNGTSTIVLKGDGTQDPEEDPLDAVYAPDDLLITGSGLLRVAATGGADGIYSETNLEVKGSGTDNGLTIEAYATYFALAAQETVTIKNSTVEAGITGDNGISAILAMNEAEEKAGMTINDSDLTLSAAGTNTAGLQTLAGDIYMNYSSVIQTPVDGAKSVSGIVAVDGSVRMTESVGYFDFGDNDADDGEYICADADDLDRNVDRSIYIKNTDIAGNNANTGLFAYFGGITLDGARVNLTSLENTIYSNFKGLTVNNSDLALLSQKGYYASAIIDNGPLMIKDSEIEAKAEGEMSSGMVVNQENTAVVSGSTTVLSLEGVTAAVEFHGFKNTANSPLKLSDGLIATEGGKFQGVFDDVDGCYDWSYSTEPLAVKNGGFTNASKKVTIKKGKSNPMTVKGRQVKVKYSQLKKKKVTIKRSRVMTLKSAKGTVTYKKVSGTGKVQVNKKNGNITIRKRGLKKGKSYKIKVRVTAAGDSVYSPLAKTVTIRIKVK